MTCQLDTRWAYEGLACLRLENRFMALDVLPERGGNILRLIDKAWDRNVLWTNPRVRPARAALHANFDDHWHGGWDEFFPTGRTCTNATGDTLPYLGEIWSQTADWRVVQADETQIVIDLVVTTPITPARFERRISLASDRPVVDIAYRVTNIGTQSFAFQWGTHPSIALTAGHRFDVPATFGEVDEWGGGAIGRSGDRYQWPHLNGIDLRKAMPAEAQCFALHYLSGLQAGFVASTDTVAKRGFGLVFDPKQLPYVWLLLNYGGWRGYYQAIIEAWSSIPSGLSSAVQRNTHVTLDPGQVFETKVQGVLYSGVDGVGHLSADGSVTPSA